MKYGYVTKYSLCNQQIIKSIKKMMERDVNSNEKMSSKYIEQGSVNHLREMFDDRSEILEFFNELRPDEENLDQDMSPEDLVKIVAETKKGLSVVDSILDVYMTLEFKGFKDTQGEGTKAVIIVNERNILPCIKKLKDLLSENEFYFDSGSVNINSLSKFVKWVLMMYINRSKPKYLSKSNVSDILEGLTKIVTSVNERLKYSTQENIGVSYDTEGGEGDIKRISEKEALNILMQNGFKEEDPSTWKTARNKALMKYQGGLVDDAQATEIIMAIEEIYREFFTKVKQEGNQPNPWEL